MLSLEAAQKEFEPAAIYVNTASIGLPPRRAVQALHEAIETWRTGRAEAAGYDGLIRLARQQFASLVGTSPEQVVIGNQVSTFSALVAAALPDGARVLVAEEDFTSVLFPFLVHADRGVHVRTVPLTNLVEAIGPGVGLVAVSAAQSADGRLAWVGTVPALELLVEVGIAAIHRHDLALANALRGRLGLPPGDSAIVTAATRGGLERLRAVGIHASARAGHVRLSFHLHNTEADVEAVAHALGC